MESLEESWEEATSGLDRDVCEKWLAKLQECYSQDKRTYHNLDYVRDKLNSFYEIKDNLKNPQAVLLAIFFGNILEFGRVPNFQLDEKNIKYFLNFADEAGIPEDAELRGTTRDLLMQTMLQEAHMRPKVFGVEDVHYFVDLDVVALGSTPEKYKEYREKVRGEYAALDEETYTSLRLRVLRNFLQIPNIYTTAEFREKYEEQARKNIQAEIEMLS